MEYSFVFFRDRIVLNNNLKSRIKLESTREGLRYFWRHVSSSSMGHLPWMAAIWCCWPIPF